MELDTEFLKQYENIINEDVNKALNYCLDILNKTKNPDLYTYIGDCLLSLERYEEAINELNMGINLRCSNKNFALCLKGEALFYLEKYKESKEVFDNLKKRNLNNFFITSYLIDIDVELGFYNKGIEKAEDIILSGYLDGNDSAYMKAKVGWINLKYLNNLTKAFESFVCALNYSIDISTVYRGLAECYLKMDEYLKAIINFQKAINLGDETIEIYYSIARAYGGLHNYSEALRYFKLVESINKNYKDVDNQITNIIEIYSK